MFLKTSKLDGYYGAHDAHPSVKLYTVICQICRSVGGEETNKWRHFAVSVNFFSDWKLSWHPPSKVKFAGDEYTISPIWHDTFHCKNQCNHYPGNLSKIAFWNLSVRYTTNSGSCKICLYRCTTTPHPLFKYVKSFAPAVNFVRVTVSTKWPLSCGILNNSQIFKYLWSFYEKSYSKFLWRWTTTMTWHGC